MGVLLYMEDILFFNGFETSLKSMESVKSEERYFEGLLTVQMKDKQGEITIVDELYKVLPIWMDRGAPISDTHSNRIIGKGINYSRTTVKNADGVDLPAIKITGKIYNDYELDNLIWDKIKNKEYKGLSFGGATRTNRTPVVMKDGSIAYALKDLEHYEVAVCKDPAVPMALITDFNPLAKAMTENITERGDKMVIQCSKFGCYVEKSDNAIKANLANFDTFEKKVQALIREGHSEESAKKIVGSFVKDEKTKTSEGGDGGTMTTETSGTNNPTYNKRPKTADFSNADLNLGMNKLASMKKNLEILEKTVFIRSIKNYLENNINKKWEKNFDGTWNTPTGKKPKELDVYGDESNLKEGEHYTQLGKPVKTEQQIEQDKKDAIAAKRRAARYAKLGNTTGIDQRTNKLLRRQQREQRNQSGSSLNDRNAYNAL